MGKYQFYYDDVVDKDIKDIVESLPRSAKSDFFKSAIRYFVANGAPRILNPTIFSTISQEQMVVIPNVPTVNATTQTNTEVSSPVTEKNVNEEPEKPNVKRKKPILPENGEF